MLSNSGVNINDSNAVKGYLNGYYNAQFSYLAYQQVISNCATYAGSYVLPRKGTQADFVESGYRFGFNGMERDDEAKGEGNSYDFGARIYDSRLGRWMSLDPLMTKHPDLSPYNYVSNSPLTMIDPDGKDNIIYLVVLPDAQAQLKKVTPQQIANQANANFKALGLNTEVRVITPDALKYTMEHRDATDGIAFLGGSKESVEQYSKPYTEAYTNWSDQQNLNPERSVAKGKGNFIALDASDFAEFIATKTKNLSPVEVIALLINHGAGHNSGLSSDHLSSDNVHNDNFLNYKNNAEIVDPKNNQRYIKNMTDRGSYGNAKASDNRLGNFFRKLREPILRNIDNIIKPKK